jgi:competence protein ComEA
MKKKIIYIIIFLILVAFIFSFGFSKKEEVVKAEMINDNSNIEKKENIKENKSIESNNIIKVDIKGAVKKPGVYEISSEKRVIDVISLAGGLNSNANTNYINLSSKVSDEMVIWIYTKNEIDKLKLEQSSTKYMIESCNCPVVDNTTCLNSNNNTSNKNDTSKSIVNINSATEEELLSITGIGESKAKNIIDYRNKNGKFNTKEDIMNVSGIGEALYNKIKDYITV